MESNMSAVPAAQIAVTGSCQFRTWAVTAVGAPAAIADGFDSISGAMPPDARKTRPVGSRGGYQAGRDRDNSGSITTDAIAPVQTICRAAAECRRRIAANNHAVAKINVLFTAYVTSMLFAFLLRLLNHCRHAIQILTLQLPGRYIQQRRHRLFG